MMQTSTEKSLKLLFNPRNVVIFEAKEKLNYFINGFKSQNFNLDNLYLVSASDEELFGIKCYKTIDELPIDTIDLLILAVKREYLIDFLTHFLNKKKINFIHIFTAGTGEFDEIGEEIEIELKKILDNHSSTKAIGPNCMGVYCPKGHNAYLPIFPTEDGKIGLIFQSGDLLTRTIVYGNSRYHIAFSKGVSVGNCVNLQVSDFIEYYENDDEIDIIAIYFEGFSKYQTFGGKKLLNLLKFVKKPVLILKGGLTKRAQSAVITHTGSLGTNNKIWNVIYKQTPSIEVSSSLDEMVDSIYIFNEFFKRYGELLFGEQIKLYPKGKNVLVILWSGGEGVLNTDILTKIGLNLPLFNGKTIERLRNVYPIKIGSLSNPLDLPWVSRSNEYVELCKAAITENIDLIVIHANPWAMLDKQRFESYLHLLSVVSWV